LASDLDFPAAFAAIFEVGNRYFSMAIPKFFAAGEAIEHLIGLRRILFALGFVQSRIPTKISALAEKRWAARKAKDFATADALRKELAAAGWAMLDGKDGYKLEPLRK
jgi:cysteinyl-tRNA synthetase